MSWKWSFTETVGAIGRDIADDLRRVGHNEETQDFSISRQRQKVALDLRHLWWVLGRQEKEKPEEKENMHKGNCYQPHRGELLAGFVTRFGE